MKKSLRVLVLLSIAASSILFATPSQAATVGGVDVTVSGTVTIASSSANRSSLASSSTSASDQIIFDFGGLGFSVANMYELEWSGLGAVGIPNSATINYDKTINLIVGFGPGASIDVYSNGLEVFQLSNFPYGGGETWTPFAQFNYKASTGVVSMRVPIVSGGGGGMMMEDVTINSDGTFAIASGTVASWVELTNFVVGVGVGVAGATTTAPNAPTSVTATATGKRSATVSFGAPTSNNGSAITLYTAISTPGGIIKTLTQATGGTFNFDGLQPGTAYAFEVTATNAIGTSAAASSNLATTTPLVVASLSALSFVDDGTGTGGKIVWAGTSIDAVLYTGSSAYYPGPYNYGAFTSGWNGRIRNLTPDTSYTVSIYAISADGVGESKSLTFKTSATLPTEPGSASATISRVSQMTNQMPDLFAWINENLFVDGEGDRMKALLNKFEAVKVPTRSAYLKLPNPTVLTVSATSSTPAVCAVEGLLTVRSIAAGTCTISYTVTGASNAPATLVKDFVFKRHAK